MLEVNKIYCMDAIEFMKQIDDKFVDMILCDLPYGIIACSWDEVIPLDLMWKEMIRIAKDNCAMVFTASQPFTSKLISSNIKMFKYELVWNKLRVSNPMSAKKQPLRQHENILVFYKKQPTYNPQPYKKNTIGNFRNQVDKHKSDSYGETIIFKNKGNYNEFGYPRSIVTIRGLINFGNENQEHPTQKPIALFEYLIKTYTNEGDLVMDCVVGSGTTAVACKNTNRNFICNDNNEEYVKIANKRLSQCQLDKKEVTEKLPKWKHDGLRMEEG